jgi:hypothetical protein
MRRREYIAALPAATGLLPRVPATEPVALRFLARLAQFEENADDFRGVSGG